MKTTTRTFDKAQIYAAGLAYLENSCDELEAKGEESLRWLNEGEAKMYANIFEDKEPGQSAWVGDLTKLTLLADESGSPYFAKEYFPAFGPCMSPFGGVGKYGVFTTGTPDSTLIDRDGNTAGSLIDAWDGLEEACESAVAEAKRGRNVGIHIRDCRDPGFVLSWIDAEGILEENEAARNEWIRFYF